MVKYDYISDYKLGLVDYIVYGCDRSSLTNTFPKVSGILSGVLKDLTSSPISIS